MIVAVSSWALHSLLITPYWDSPAGPKPSGPEESSGMDLLDLPERLRAHGYQRLELCHFHLPSREPAYLSELRSALRDSGVKLQTLLIDDGDISDPETADRDAAWISGWVDTAAALGSEGARVIAGKQPWSDETSARSAKHLACFTDRGVRIRLENWFDLLRTPAQVFDLLERLEGKVGLCMDYGNWGGPTKYEDLAAIAPRAETCHAKCEFVTAGKIDEDDYARCLALSHEAGYAGPFVIVNGGAGGDPWEALRLQTDFIRSSRPTAPAG